MVLTRSQLASGSPRKPPTARTKRKERTKRNSDSSSDDEGSLQMTDVKKSLSDHLEPINEEDETVATTPDSEKKTVKKRWSVPAKQTEHRSQKTPLKIPFTIEEETADEHSHDCSDDEGGIAKDKLECVETDNMPSSGLMLGLNTDNESIDLDDESKIAISTVRNHLGDKEAEGTSLLLDGDEKTSNEPETASSSLAVPAKIVTPNKTISGKPKSRFYFPPPKTLVPPTAIETSIDVGMDVPDSYIDVKGTKQGKKKMDKLFAEATVSSKDSRVKDSVITSDFERNSVAPGEKSSKQKWRERKTERESTAGKEWFNLARPEMTTEVKRDLEILQMRSVLDPKRFYKHNDRKALPKYFQVGRVMDNAADFYSSRVPKKERKANLTEELLADAEFQRYQKRKYNEIQMQKKTRFVKRSKAKRQKFSSKAKDDG